MLSDLEAATVRAALRYWREEICPSGGEAAAAYFDRPAEDFLSDSEVRDLERRFTEAQLRYIAYEPVTEQIVAAMLIPNRASAQRLIASGVQVGTVLLD